jgi:hypothetical protein
VTISRTFRCNQCGKEASEDEARYWGQVISHRPDFNFSPAATHRDVFDICSTACLKAFAAKLYDPAAKAG